MKKHSRRKGRLSGWFSRMGDGALRRKLTRSHNLEWLERRELLAADALLASQTVLVGEGEGELVRFRAAIVDANGNSLSTIPAGGDFTVRVFVQDVRAADPKPSTTEDDRGVFSAYLDLAYTNGLATFVGPVTFSSDYQLLPSTGTQEPGLLNEVGSTQSLSGGLPEPFGPDEVLFFSAAFKAATTAVVDAADDSFGVTAGSVNNVFDVLANDAASGLLSFTPNAAEGAGNEVLFFEAGSDGNPISPNNILFEGDSVQVTGLGTPTITAAGGAQGQTAHGTVTIIEGGTKLRYTPTAGYTGTDTFTYTVQNGSSTAEATVTVNVTQAIDKVQFAKDLAAAGVKYYGADWCTFCTEQKQLFEDGEAYLPFIEVTNPDRTINQVGQQNNITTFPTWVFADNSRVTGVQTLEQLSLLSGVPLPDGSDPFLAPIDDVDLLAGAPLHIPLDGYDPNGSKLTYTVQVSGPAGVTAQVLASTRSLRINMEGYEDMVFRLFDNDVKRVTDAIAALADQGIYDGTIFHRVIDNFVIQGGDPTGTGFGDPTLPKFDDQFHFDLQHTQTGLLSMAKAGDDTNSSQFFVTELVDISDADKQVLSQPTIDVNALTDPNVKSEFQSNAALKARLEAMPAELRILFMQQIKLRRLDFNHSVFGVLVEGEAARAGISRTATGAQDKPSNTVRMTSAEIFNDEENGVLRLKAAAGATGAATVTVTATDQEGKTTTRTFNVNVLADPFNGGPFLDDIGPVRTSMNTAGTFQLVGRDVEGDPVTYTATLPSGATNFTFSVNATTGLVSYTPPQGFVGTLKLNVGVRPQGTSDTADVSDMQLVNIEVAPGAPTGIDLVDASDTGISSTDNITNATSVQFLVTGVTNGATVQILRGNTLVGTAVASGTSATVTVTGANSLPAGAQQFTAKQVVGGAASNASAALTVTFDRTAPPAMSSTPPTQASVGNLFTYNAQNPEETTPGVFYSLVNPPSGLSINQSTGVVSWTPASSQTGAQTFMVRARDAAGNSVDQTINLTVVDGPAKGDQYTTNEDSPLTVNAANGVLKNDDAGTTGATLVANAQNGTVTLNPDGSFTYTPAANFQGTDTFTYRATNDGDETNIASVTITVNNTPDAPTAVNDSYTVNEDQTLTVNQANGVQKNDQNPDGVPLTSTVVAGPAHGTLTLNANGSFTYTPTADYSGTDTFTYRLTSSSGDSNTATVTLNVTAQNDPPVANNDTYSAVEDQVLTVNAANGVLKNDTDPEGAALVGFLVSNPQHGTLNFNAQDGSFTYTPAPNFFGTDTFTYRASDNNSNSANVATVTINVAGQNDAPSVQGLTLTSYKNSPRTFYALADFANRITDPDGSGQTFRVTAVANPSQGGTVEVAADGSGFYYTPKANFTGTETFSITVADQGNLTGSGTATMSVLEFKPGSLAGFVYLDGNDDGVLNDGEGRVAGVTVTLTGTLLNGTPITQRTAVTKADGSYKFDNLQPGTYTIAETQPGILIDGKDTVGSQNGTSTTNDQFVIQLAEGVDGTGNNFGEHRPVASYSMLDFLAVKPNGSVLIAANSTSDSSPFFIIESGWDGLTDVDARLSTDGKSATVNIQETDGDKFKAENVASFHSLMSSSSLSLIRLYGNRSAFSFQPVTATQSTSQTQLTQDEEDTGDQTQDQQDQGEGEADDSLALMSQFDASGHGVSLSDYLNTSDVTTDSTPADATLPESAKAIDAALTQMADDEASAAQDVASSTETSDDEFLDAVDSVFQEDAAL